jgi:hypothetical protein
MFDWAALQDVLTAPSAPLPEAAATGPAPDPILGRLRQILLKGPPGPASGDFAALVRHTLMARVRGSARPRLLVPRGPGWPSLQEWRATGMLVAESPTSFNLEARPWRPAWLPPADEAEGDIFAEAFAGLEVRRSADTLGDPFLAEATGYDAYVCPGQREAVRSLLFLPAGETLIVNLPTGSGKTLVGQAPALLRGLEGGLTLFVVPTTALAVDQARRIRGLLRPHDQQAPRRDFAWHSGLNQASRAAILRRIWQGTQGILFTSPESAVGTLLQALHGAARNGTFRYLVIDEAHLIAQWGDSFRPAFQMLSGLRRGLLKHCVGELFRTVLMSATLGPQTVATLQHLFGPPEAVQMVSAVRLRPEPRYWSCRVADEEEQVARVLEVVRHAPRPFILYVTERKDAREWLRRLQDAGFGRTACFHGDTPDSERESIIDSWAADCYDGIVATSAFGVGIDKADVRTVIHATVPETLDRFYQEVGRGGRDGRASASVVIYTDRDRAGAKRIANPSIIGEDLAYERWAAMFASRETGGEDGLWVVDLNALRRELRREGDYNRDWNMRTLILLVRAGLMELHARPPWPGRISATDPGEDETEDAWRDDFSKIPLRTLDPRHLDRAYFDRQVGTERYRSAKAAGMALDAVLAVLEGRREMSEALSDFYRIDIPGLTVPVSGVCRGCRALPARNASLPIYAEPPGIGIGRVVPANLFAWRQRFPSFVGDFGVILCPPGEARYEQRLERALEILVALFGVREIAAPTALWRRAAWLKALHRRAPDRVLIARTLEEEARMPSMLPLTRASVLWPWDDAPIPDHVLLLDGRPLHLVLAPADIRGDHPLRRHADTATHCMDLETFLDTATR